MRKENITSMTLALVDRSVRLNGHIQNIEKFRGKELLMLESEKRAVEMAAFLKWLTDNDESETLVMLEGMYISAKRLQKMYISELEIL